MSRSALHDRGLGGSSAARSPGPERSPSQLVVSKVRVRAAVRMHPAEQFRVVCGYGFPEGSRPETGRGSRLMRAAAEKRSSLVVAEQQRTASRPRSSGGARRSRQLPPKLPLALRPPAGATSGCAELKENGATPAARRDLAMDLPAEAPGPAGSRPSPRRRSRAWGHGAVSNAVLMDCFLGKPGQSSERRIGQPRLGEVVEERASPC